MLRRLSTPRYVNPGQHSGVEQLVARRDHIPEVAGSSPVAAMGIREGARAMAEPFGKCVSCGVLLSSESKGRWGTAWCAKCDKIRIEQISGQLKEIAACFPNKNEAQAVTDQKATCPKCNEPWDGCYCSSCFYRLTPTGQIRELRNQLAAKDKRIGDLTVELRNATASIWDRMAELGKAHDTIKSLTRERDEAQAEAKLVAPTAIPPAPVFDTDLREYVRVITQEDVGNLCINVSDGRRLLVEIDRLRRLEAAVDDDSLMRVFYKDSGHADVTKLILCSYRDALLAALHDNALAQRIGAEAADLDQDCDTAIRWYRQAVLKAGKKD